MVNGYREGYPSKAELEKEHWDHGKSVRQIAREWSIPYPSLRKYMVRLGIPRRPKGLQGVWSNRDWLEDQYIYQVKGGPQIAREQGITPQTIDYWLRKHEIPRRSKSLATHLAAGNHVDLPPEALDFIEGELLGDGCLSSCSQWSAFYAHGTKHRKYLEWLSNQLNNWGLEQTGTIHSILHPADTFGPKRTSWNYASLSYAELHPLYEKWYPNGDKRVPEDFQYTPLSLRQHYLGDGGWAGPELAFNAHCFPRVDVCHLVDNLHQISLSARLSQDYRYKGQDRDMGWKIYIPKGSLGDFFSYIGPCPSEIESVYGYKWPTA